ncbi:YfiT family bacillithiol transferase [Gorillibacterium sp. sgz5001074]|uniref:YfiT family bacillithiol transferase n=1 Tax=Gorillibacterium sp. sgz5001074 TaxID=3446695 RepID=UPI003F669707
MNDALRYPIGRFEADPSPTAELRKRTIEEIRRLPDELRAAVLPLTPEQRHTPYRPGGWTVQQVVHHLADNDMNACLRFKRALTEENPTAGTYREEAWAAMEDYRLAPAEISIALLEALYSRFVILLAALDPADYSRTFISPTHGLMTLDTALQRFAWHGRHHLAQIVSLKERSGW